MWGLWLVVGLTAWFLVWVSILHVHQHACTAASYGDDDDDDYDEKGGGSPWTVMADAAAVAVDLILARSAWAVVAHDNNRDDNGKGGDPPIPNDATASGFVARSTISRTTKRARTLFHAPPFSSATFFTHHLFHAPALPATHVTDVTACAMTIQESALSYDEPIALIRLSCEMCSCKNTKRFLHREVPVSYTQLNCTRSVFVTCMY